MQTAITEVIPPEEVPANLRRADSLAIFESFKSQMESLRKTAETIEVKRIDDKAGQALARTTRLQLRQIRIAVEAKRKELTEEALREKQKIDSIAKSLKDALERLETRLEEQEKFPEIEAARLEQEAREKRGAELALLLIAPCIVDLGKLTEEQWQQVLADAVAAKTAREEAARKAEEERIAREKAEAEERARQEAERKRLAEELAAAQKKQREMEAAAAEERRVAEAKAAEERRKAAAALEEERRKAQAEADRIRKEQEARLAEERRKSEAARKEQEAKAAEERRLRMDAERKQREAAEAEAQRIEAEAAEKRRAANAPDAEKLRSYAAMILNTPALSSGPLSDTLNEQAVKFAKWIETQAKKITA